MLLPIYSSLVLQPESQRRTSRLKRLFHVRIPFARFFNGRAWVGASSDAPVSFVSGLQTLSCACPPLFTDRGRFPAVHKGVSMSRHESVPPEHAGFSHNLLDFEKEIFCPSIRSAMEHVAIGITPLFDSMERAPKIILGLATICKLARNNQELASGGSSEEQPLALITMENLFNLAEITSAFFISEVESLAYGMRQHFSDSKQTATNGDAAPNAA